MKNSGLKLKLYKVFIKDVEKAINLEAHTFDEAKDILTRIGEKTGTGVTPDDIVDMKIETLIVGESSKIKNGQKLIWVGQENSANGWMKETEFVEMSKKQKQN